MQRTVLGSVVLIGLAFGSVPAAQQARAASPSMTIAARPISAEAISGVWDYNDALSVDAATGRPERAPRSATQRQGPAGPPAASGGGAGRNPGSSGAPGGGERGGGRGEGADEARRAMAAVIAAERRTYVRDLLEVPEKLTIRASDGEVTFVDDLARERTYSTDGRMQKYQLSAARYEARGTWSGTYFRKDIQGSNNFKMSETYFLSEDGNRLFVIIRIGDPRKPETLAGVNRVYDRVSTTLAR